MTVLVLVGLLGPTLNSVSEVENTDEVISVVNSLKLSQNSPEIATASKSKFGKFTMRFGMVVLLRCLFSKPTSPTSDVIGIQIGFDAETAATVGSTEFQLAAARYTGSYAVFSNS